MRFGALSCILMRCILMRCMATGCFLLAGALPAVAQRGRRLDCPGPARSHAGQRLALPPVRWELSAGVTRPFLYRNGAATDDQYQFNALVTPYAGVTGYAALNDRLEVFAGLALTQTWQGLEFRHDGTGGDLRINSYAGSLVASLPVGIRYRASRALQLSAGPYLSVSTHRGPAGGSTDGLYTYAAPDDPQRLNGGLRLAADLRLSRHLGAMVSGAADAGMATPSSGTADLRSQGEGVRTGTLEPYLLHLGLGLRYRFRPDAD